MDLKIVSGMRLSMGLIFLSGHFFFWSGKRSGICHSKSVGSLYACTGGLLGTSFVLAV